MKFVCLYELTDRWQRAVLKEDDHGDDDGDDSAALVGVRPLHYYTRGDATNELQTLQSDRS